jgi:hypothetical protein
MHWGPSRFAPYRHPHGFYSHRWIRGERLPVAYFARPYVIADYRDCGLRRPPRGYHWVRVDGDAVLAAVATGIVLDTVLHVFNSRGAGAAFAPPRPIMVAPRCSTPAAG